MNETTKAKKKNLTSYCMIQKQLAGVRRAQRVEILNSFLRNFFFCNLKCLKTGCFKDFLGEEAVIFVVEGQEAGGCFWVPIHEFSLQNMAHLTLKNFIKVFVFRSFVALFALHFKVRFYPWAPAAVSFEARHSVKPSPPSFTENDNIFCHFSLQTQKTWLSKKVCCNCYFPLFPTS